MTVALTEKRLQVNFGTYRVSLMVTLFGFSLSRIIMNWMPPFPHARGVTGGSDTVPSCGVRPTVVVVTAPGIVLVPDVAQCTMSCYCC